MRNTSPFRNLSTSQEKTIWVILFIFFIGVTSLLLYLDTFLKNEICRNGIVSFEFVRNAKCAQDILDSWNVTSKIAAGLSMGIDFLYPIIYSSFIGLVVHKLNKQHRSKRVRAMGNLSIWVCFLAAFFDYIENVSLVQLLLGNISDLWASIATTFASLKFICLIPAFIFILYSIATWMSNKITR